MKRKSFVAIGAVALGLCLFSACTDIPKVTFNPYWYQDVDIVPENTLEELEYAVGFEAGTGLYNYSMHYSDGVYKTKLVTKAVDGKKVYEYTTELSINVTYQYESTVSDKLADYVKTSVVFERETNNLYPISSHKELLSHSPINGDVNADFNFADWKYHYTVDVDYSKNEAVVVSSPNTENARTQTHSFEIDDEYTYLDNEQLLFALRGVNPSTTTAPKFSVYAPFTKAVQNVSATFASKAAESFSFTKNGEEFSGNVSYFPVSLVLNQKDEGATQTLWIAAADNVKDNKFRNVILRYEAPVSYNLGTLIYTLKSANFS